MATKLKIFNPVLKAVAFILIVALSIIAMLKLIDFSYASTETLNGWSVHDIGKKEYTETDRCFYYVIGIDNHFMELRESLAGRVTFGAENEIDNLFYSAEWNLIQKLINQYEDEELSPDILWQIFERDYAGEIENQTENLFYQVEWEIRQSLINRGLYGDDNEIPNETLWETFESDFAGRITTQKESLFENNKQQIIESMKEKYEEQLSYEQLREAFEKEYAVEIANILQKSGDSFKEWLNLINDFEGIVYYIEVGETVHKNSDLDYEGIQQEYSHCYTDESFYGKEHKQESERYIFALTNEYTVEKNRELTAFNAEVTNVIIFASVWLVLFLICGIFLVCAAGRKTAESGIKMISIDKIFGEITLALITGAVWSSIFWADYLSELRHNNTLKYVYIGVLALFFVFIYIMISSVIRHIKNKTFIKNLLIVKILKRIYGVVRKSGKSLNFMFSKQNPMIKATLIILGLGVLTMIPFVGLITIPVILILSYKQIRIFDKLESGVLAIKNGDYDTIIDVPTDSYYSRTAHSINKIASGLNEEVERRIKSERLKTELIINVSHDIRTPLTSLITYADLLKSEETDNENILKYAEIISQKSERLKVLTDDLFESAKAASGNITVNFEYVEINALLIQALAEFDARIKESNLEFKLNIPEEKVIAYADGSLLWRVFENLISNTLKYSLENSRVYIDVRDDGNYVFIEMKNISKAELNIPEDELAERFKRGDLSRNSEGSGLGLDIATSLMRCQNGELSMKIDGDLFKVCIKIKKSLVDQ